jgi:hypothetical protein
MNLELVSKLYEQSYKTIPHNPTSGFDAQLEDRVFVPEVFAELIVKECIDVCANGWQGEFTAAGISQCVSDLREHFGVET